MKNKSISDIATVSICVSILALFLICAVFAPPSNISEEENREAAEPPSFSARAIMSGEFFDSFSNFLSDNFPLRSSLISLDSAISLAMGEQEIKGVFYTKSGGLIFKGEYTELETAHKNAQAISKLSYALGGTVAIIPRACDVQASELPTLYDTRRQYEVYKAIDNELPSAVSLRNSIFEGLSELEYPFYRADHHWTTEGAYSAYKAIAKELGIVPYGEDFFYKETVSESFLGTAHSRASLSSVLPDSITLYRYDRDESYSISVTDGTGAKTLYDFSALEGKDKYKIFLGGNYPRISIRAKNSSGERPTLLLIKDSFANALIPFLALHFDLEVIDPRYCTLPISAMISASDFDSVLILFGADTLATTPMYNKLK